MYKLLVIEDDQEIRENLKNLFDPSGYETYLSSNGLSGIKMAEDLIPDLILCNTMIPVVDGFQVKKRLNENIITQVIPFIFLTSNADIGSFRAGMNLCADDYIVKPVRDKDLLKIVFDRLQRINIYRDDGNNKNNTSRLTLEDKILLHVGEEHLIVPLKDILFIEVRGNYTIVNLVDKKKAIQKKSLKSWEEILPEKSFIRAHHKTIINFSFVAKIEPLFNGSLIIKMKNYPDDIICSKRYSQKIKKIFNI